MAEATFYSKELQSVQLRCTALASDVSKIYDASSPLSVYQYVFNAPTVDNIGFVSECGFYFAPSFYTIGRTVFAIDTSSLSDNANITGAVLHIKAGRTASDNNPTGDLELWDSTFPDSYLPFQTSTQEYAKTLYNSRGTNKLSSIPVSSLPVAYGYNQTSSFTLVIDPSKLSIINKTGFTKFILVESFDVNHTLPTDLDENPLVNTIDKIEGSVIYDLELVITYSTGGGTITVPSKPQNVIASKVNDTTGRLVWQPPANDGGSSITGYNITPFNVTDSTQLTAIDVPVSPLTRDFTLPTDKVYKFLIYAKNIAGNGQVEISNTITLGTPAGPPPPPPPPGVTVPGPPSNLQGVGLNGSIALGWNVPTTDGGAAITNYVIEYRETAGAPTILTIGPVLNYIINGLNNNVTYIVKVAAKNSAGTGPYCDPLYISTSTQTDTFELTSWSKFNDILDTGPDHQFSGLTALAYSDSMTELYNTPTVVYKDLDIKGRVTYRSCKRKNTPYEYSGGGTAYYLPPTNNTIGDGVPLAQALISHTIGAAYQQPNAGYVADILKYSGRPGDAVAFYKKYVDYYATPNIAFSGDDGFKACETWKYNVYVQNCTSTSQCMMPGWPFDYIQNRPFLRFDTRKYVPLNEVLSAALSFNIPAGLTVSNQDNITHLEIRAVNKMTVGDNNLNDGNYDDYTSNVVGVIPVLNNVALLNGQTVTVSIQASAIAVSDITKFVIVGSHEATSLPTGWNEFVFENVKLTVLINNNSIETPGECEDVTAAPEDKKITLSWTRPLFTGGSEITAYTIKEINTGLLVTVPMVDPTIIGYSKEITGLTNGVLYSFIIYASNLFGQGIATPISATPTVEKTGPGAVRDFAALPQDGGVILYWNPPSNLGTYIPPCSLKYILKNNTTGRTWELSGVTSYEVTGLSNGYPYTFQIQAGLSPPPGPGIGGLDAFNGPISTITVTPTDGTTVPGLPDVYAVYAAKGYATVYWIPPAYTGGLSIMGWKIKIEAPASQVFEPLTFVVSNPNLDNFTIHPLNPDSTYIISVAAFNSAGTGPYDDSDPFILLTGPYDNSVLVDVDYNYTKFYPAPVELNRNLDTYEDFLYPKEVTEALPASIISDLNVTYPVIISPSTYMLYLHHENPNGIATPNGTVYSIDYSIPIAPVIIQDNFGPLELQSGGSTQTTFAPWPSAMSLNDVIEFINNYANSYQIPVRAEGSVNNRLIIKTTTAGEGVILNFETSIGQVTPANLVLFGENPVISNGTILYQVKNYVPTVEYDSTNKKALVESRVWNIERNVNISEPSLYSEKLIHVEEMDQDVKVWDLPHFPNYHTFIKPNSVTIQYYDDNGKLYSLRDYYGDGRLMYRRKISEYVGATVTLEYPKDIPSNYDPTDGEACFGTIDYENGSITNLMFPTIYAPLTTDIISTFKAATIVGSGVKWPIFINAISWIYLVVDGEVKHYQINQNQPGETYIAADIADALNSQESFIEDGLVAGVGFGGQLYIKYAGKLMEGRSYRQHIGPTSTLKLLSTDNIWTDPSVGRAPSVNKLFFGLNPTTIPCSTTYLTYTYTNNDSSPYRYIWYQTPHFVLVSRNTDSIQYITKGHLAYLKEKLSYFKPINTILDNVNFMPTLQDGVKLYDTFKLYTVDTTNVETPYIFIEHTPTSEPGTYHVIVQNPDGQQNLIAIADFGGEDPNINYTYSVPV